MTPKKIVAPRPCQGVYSAKETTTLAGTAVKGKKQTWLAGQLVLLGGCGALPPAPYGCSAGSPCEASEPAAMDGWPASEDANSASSATPPLFLPGAAPPAVGSANGLFDGYPLFELVGPAELLDLLLDSALLDWLPVASPGLEMTYLERLCRQTGQPDYYCWQRYGR